MLHATNRVDVSDRFDGNVGDSVETRHFVAASLHLRDDGEGEAVLVEDLGWVEGGHETGVVDGRLDVQVAIQRTPRGL